MARSAAGTDFRTEDATLQRVLDRVRRDCTRVRVTYDGNYGRYGRDYDFGYIGRSMGNPNYPNGGMKVPLLVHNSRSRGGECLLDHRVVKVETSRRRVVLWEKEG